MTYLYTDHWFIPMFFMMNSLIGFFQFKNKKTFNTTDSHFRLLDSKPLPTWLERALLMADSKRSKTTFRKKDFSCPDSKTVWTREWAQYEVSKTAVLLNFEKFNLANLEQYIGSTLSTNFFPKDIEFVRPTAYFLNSGMHHKENLLSLASFFTRDIWKTQACISVSSKSLL